MLAAVVLFLVPPSVNDPDDGGRVSCGTLLFTTEYSFSDACQDVRVARITAGLFAWLAAVVLGTAGLVVLYGATRWL